MIFLQQLAQNEWAQSISKNKSKDNITHHQILDISQHFPFSIQKNVSYILECMSRLQRDAYPHTLVNTLRPALEGAILQEMKQRLHQRLNFISDLHQLLSGERRLHVLICIIIFIFVFVFILIIHLLGSDMEVRVQSRMCSQRWSFKNKWLISNSVM